MTDNIAGTFEMGVRDYFVEFNDRHAKERTHHLWLGGVLARHISIHRILSEFDIPLRDIFFDSPQDIKSRGLANFDIAIARNDQVDARQYWTRNGLKRDAWDDTSAATMRDLAKIGLVAELKTATTSSGRRALISDLLKLSGIMRFLQHNGAKEFPDCYFILFDPNRTLSIQQAWSEIRPQWPDGMAGPNVLIGPPYERLVLEH